MPSSEVAKPERGPEQSVSAVRPAAQPPAPAPPPLSSAASTFLDSSIAFEGVIRSREPLRLDCRVKGEIHCDHGVVIGESAHIEATIRADAVVIAGEVRGEIHATRKITLAATARIVGNLTTPGIVIEEGAELVGRIQIGARASERAAESDPPETAESHDRDHTYRQ
jgi:cytoskeletal protein CcmA (bactofilin family)